MSRHWRTLALACIVIAVGGALLMRGAIEDKDSSRQIYLGQPFDEARTIAHTAGYDLHDVAELAVAGGSSGFYIDLPSQRGLIVHHDLKTNVVNGLDLVENWSGPKAARVYRAVEAFRLSPRTR